MPKDQKRRQKALERHAAKRKQMGVDGKPYFVSGPFDNVPRIMARLEKAVGPGNFEFLVGGPGGVLLDDELP